MGRRRAIPRCLNGDHVYEPMQRSRNGLLREKCCKCGDIFPCRNACGHYDCMQARGEPSPLDPDYYTNLELKETVNQAVQANTDAVLKTESHDVQ